MHLIIFLLTIKIKTAKFKIEDNVCDKTVAFNQIFTGNFKKGNISNLHTPCLFVSSLR